MQKHIFAIGLIAAGGRVLNLRVIVAPGTTTSVPEQNLRKFDKIASLDALRYLVSHRNIWVSFESLGVHFKQEMMYIFKNVIQRLNFFFGDVIPE